MDIVEFIEKACGWQLLECQKEYVTKLYESFKNFNKPIVYIPPRHCDSFNYEILLSLVYLLVARERGLIKVLED